MKLILVRHGLTEENKNKIWQGHTEGTLSEEGKEQAKKLAKKLEKEPIDIVYCSDLQRTKNTIKPFLKNKTVQVYYAKELRERKLGILEGAKTDKIEEYLSKHKIDFEASNFETGETGYEMRSRLAKFYEEVAKKHENDTVLFVTHGGSIANLILHLFDHPADMFSEFIPDNASITRIETKEGKPKLLSFNDVSHL